MIDVIILAIVQGIAEFLPISSSGHLVIIAAVLREFQAAGSTLEQFKDSPTLEIILHAGTLGSILVVFWQRILRLLTSDRRVIGLLIVGTIPAALVGLTIKSAFEPILKSTPLSATMLLITGVLLIALGRLKPRDNDYQKMSLGGAFLVGCFQAFAILPGISRSGSTILGGRLTGLKNDDSVTFSFLLAIPAILGATVLLAKDVLDTGGGAIAGQIGVLVAGAVVAFLVGIVSLKWLIGWSREDRLHWFAWWCIPVGLVTLTLWATGRIS